MRIRFPDSEICGSKGARPSPQLIAACYVLHRLCAPRHPPDALALTLDRSAFVPCPETKPAERPTKFRVRIHAISLECRIKIYRPCKPANPAFTMSMTCRTRDRVCTREHILKLIVSVVLDASCGWQSGGANRDRTDDLKLAKLALSQLSYGPVVMLRSWIGWWAWEDLNFRPHAYQARALTN